MITVDENRRDDYLQQKRIVVSEPGCWPMKQAPEAGGCARGTWVTGDTGNKGDTGGTGTGRQTFFYPLPNTN